MRPIRVGFDARWYNDSGVGTYVGELLRALAAVHREIDLIIYEDPQNPVSGLDHSSGLDHHSMVRIPVHSKKYSLREQWEFRRRAAEDRLDLFHCPFYAVPLTLNCPLVVTVHDLIPFLFRIYGWPKHQMVKTGYRIAGWRAAHIIADSANTARDVTRFLNVVSGRISVVPLAAKRCFQPKKEGRELERLHETYDIRPPYVMIPSSRDLRTKNLEGALRAAEIAGLCSGLDFQTVVYGHQQSRTRDLKKAWPGLNLRLIGYIDDADLAAMFRNAHSLLIASLYEGFGLPLIEAMACGCAVVTSSAGSLAEVAGGGAQAYSPTDLEAMGAALARLLTLAEERERWKTAGLQRARDFSWAKTASETLSIYDRVASQYIGVRGAQRREHARTS